MIKEYQKYGAEVFKIGGFALMTPLGRFVLDTLHFNFSNLTQSSVINIITSFLLFLLGIMFIQIGYETVWE